VRAATKKVEAEEADPYNVDAYYHGPHKKDWANPEWIAVPRDVIHHVGIEAAGVLGHLAGCTNADEEGWVPFSARDAFVSLGLSTTKAQRLLAILEGAGLIKTGKWGMPCSRFVKVCTPRVTAISVRQK
jgi:hypothetical protein